jgi:hypothetical protein
MVGETWRFSLTKRTGPVLRAGWANWYWLMSPLMGFMGFRFGVDVAHSPVLGWLIGGTVVALMLWQYSVTVTDVAVNPSLIQMNYPLTGVACGVADVSSVTLAPQRMWGMCFVRIRRKEGGGHFGIALISVNAYVTPRHWAEAFAGGLRSAGVMVRIR